MKYLRITTLSLILFCIFIPYSCTQQTNGKYVLLKTTYGDIKIELYNDTPIHKENFLKLTSEGFYNDLLFHRVINGFMIQGGDPDSKNAQPGSRLGVGGPGYTLEAEFRKHHFHQKGALAAARQGDNMNPEKRSSGSQFYIVQGKTYTESELTTDYRQLQEHFRKFINEPENATLRNTVVQLQNQRRQAELQALLMQYKETLESYYDVSFYVQYPTDRLEAYTSVGGTPHLDDAYTVFGQVIEGLDIIDKIAAVKTDQTNRPAQDIKFSIEIVK